VGPVIKALGVIISAVMMAGLLAENEEAFGESLYHQGKRFEAYRGMGNGGVLVPIFGLGSWSA
jgi:IMP dehydrogenase/GMP reductase